MRQLGNCLKYSFRFNFDFPCDGDNEVDSGPAGDEGSDCHHQASLLRVPHRDGHLYVGHVDLVGKVEPVTLRGACLVTVGDDPPVRAV